MSEKRMPSPHVRASFRLICLVAMAAILGAPGIAAQESVRALTTQAGVAAYNLDYDEAERLYQQALSTRPDDPVAHRGLATVFWLRISFSRGMVSVDELLGSGVRARADVVPPPPALAAGFFSHAQQALRLCERMVKVRPRDADAQYQYGASVGLLASYTATVEGRIVGAIRDARAAYNAHERVLQLDPARKDAGLIVGTYRYVVSMLSLPNRWLAYIVGFGGGRETGLRMIEEAARFTGASQVEARFALVLFYTREQRYNEAIRELAALRASFPRNRLLWLEGGAAALRAGRAADARALLEEGVARLAQDPRPRAFGEESLWSARLAAAYLATRDLTRARSSLNRALAVPARDWVRARTHLALGQVNDLEGRRGDATREYELAIRSAQVGRDLATRDEARRCLQQPYRYKS
jgi:tetratricopeptide (TPR) repeat protein